MKKTTSKMNVGKAKMGGMPGMPAMGSQMGGMPGMPAMGSQMGGMPGMPGMGSQMGGMPQNLNTIGMPSMPGTEAQGMMPSSSAPANGAAYTPDGKGQYTASPIFTGNNLEKAKVPTTMAASSGMGSGMASGMGMNYGQQMPPEEPEEEMEEEEEEEDEYSDVSEVEEQAKAQFKNALVELLGEEVATDNFLNKLEGIFEAAVQDRVNLHVNRATAHLDNNVKNYLNNVTTTLVEKVDDYLDYVVEEWVVENKIAVEQGIKTQIAENFINGLKNLFENHYINVPDEKYDVLDEIYEQNQQLQNSLNNAINENISIKKEKSLTECAGIFVAETKDLADTQIAKLQNLMESVSFTTPEEYRNKLLAIKNNYLSSQSSVRPRPALQQINEEMTFSPVKQVESSTVEGYANVIGKLNKKL
jgi:hypothetical protein